MELKQKMATIVLYPSPGMGHLISMVELGKLILTHYPSTTITILYVPPSFNTGSTASYIRQISSTFPSITFHNLPHVQLDFGSFPSMESIIFETLRRSNVHVKDVLSSRLGKVSALIIDFFCTTVLPVAKEFGIPTYYFITSGACALAFAIRLPILDAETTLSFKDMGDTLLDVPGLPKFPASDMWKPLLDRECSDYNDFLDWSYNVPNADGVLVNSFEYLESKILKFIRERKCNPDSEVPPVFCIGPLISTVGSGSGRGNGGEDCIKWLDTQPKKSVVFLCFGSLGLLRKEQLEELAVGLEMSGKRFLWVVRSPPVDDKSKRFLPPVEPDLDLLLPDGFLERTRDRGFVVKSWAPQVDVLRHESVGGFVTHCGWNSVLESVMAGVPMVAWPLYAEQHFNRVVLVEDMGLALRVREGKDGLMAAKEVERVVNELMDSDKGNEVRGRVERASEEAKAAMIEGGSTSVALTQLAQLWKLS